MVLKLTDVGVMPSSVVGVMSSSQPSGAKITQHAGQIFRMADLDYAGSLTMGQIDAFLQSREAPAQLRELVVTLTRECPSDQLLTMDQWVELCRNATDNQQHQKQVFSSVPVQ